MIENKKTVEDTYSTGAIVDSISSSVQMKQVMVQQTPGRYMLKAMMAGLLFNRYCTSVRNKDAVCEYSRRWTYQFNGSHCVLV